MNAFLLCLALLAVGLFRFTDKTDASESHQTHFNGESSSNSIIRYLKKDDVDSATRLYYQKLGFLSLEERNAIFLRAAQLLVMTNNNDDVIAGSDKINYGDLEFMTQLSLMSYPDHPGAISYKNRSITTPDAIPYLINALANSTGPEPAFILKILQTMTRRSRGFADGEEPFFEQNRKAIVHWWQKWWRENYDKHPVFDEDLDKVIRREMLKIDHSIKRGPVIWDSPESYQLEHGEWSYPTLNPMLYGSYSPILYGHAGPITGGANFKNGSYSADMGDDVLCLSWDFATQDLVFSNNDSGKNIKMPDSFPVKAIFGNKVPAREIFHETIPGTGIEIKVEIASTKTELINNLRTVLNR